MALINFLFRWTYEFEIRYPNKARAEGFSTLGTCVGRPYLTEKGAGTGMEKHIRSLTTRLDGLGLYTVNETVRRNDWHPNVYRRWDVR